MAYMHIHNLYKARDILLFKECWALEKIHGTSAWATYYGRMPTKALVLHPGQMTVEKFAPFFPDDLLERMIRRFGDRTVRLNGEHYGGIRKHDRIQKMGHVYGERGFVLFDVRVDDIDDPTIRRWLSFDKVQIVGAELGLDVVHGVRIPCDMNHIDEQRDSPSQQAIKRGMGMHHPREGIVLRPLEEFTRNNGARVIAKHKTDAYCETTTRRDVSEAKLKVLKDADAIAFEWVTEQRLEHVLQTFDEVGIELTGQIIKRMIDDVEREGEGELVMSKDARKCIAKRTALMFKAKLEASLYE